MACSRQIGMRQLIDQNERGMAPERGIEIEIGELPAPMRYRFGGYDFQDVEQCRRFGATVGFHDAGDYIVAFAAQLARGQQHRESLADARRRAEIDAQLPTLRLRLAVDLDQQ